MTEHVLQIDEPKGAVTAVVLVLHGGRSRSTGPVRPTQLSVLRMRPFVSSLRAAGADQGLAVAQLRYAVRGWNGSDESPVPDTRWALGQLAERFPGTPTALVGHSLGGRAAVYAADHASVRALVGLAPWIEPGDPYHQLAGRRVLFAHGDLDRMTSPDESAGFARRASTVADSVSYVSIHGDRHPMLRRARLWHDLATGYVLAVLCGQAPGGTVRPESANLLQKALAGEATLVA